MSYTIAQARDLLTQHIVNAWVAGGFNTDNIVFDDIKKDSNPAAGQTWVRVKIRHGNSRQVTLADSTGKTKFERKPNVYLQIFTPSGGGLTENDAVVQILLDAFEGRSIGNSDIWFRRTSSKEMGVDGNFFKANVFTEVSYDQIK